MPGEPLPVSQQGIHVVPVASLKAICVDCGQGMWGGPPCEHKIKRVAEREAARMTGKDLRP